MNALLLAGHGSHISPHTAGLVWSYVDRLRALGIADEVGASFWKEAPAFSQVLDSFCSDTVIVVPALAADGYFARTVIPAEMGLSGPLTCRGTQCIHYTQPLGLHPRLGDVLHNCVSDLMTEQGWTPATSLSPSLDTARDAMRAARARRAYRRSRLSAVGLA